MLGVHSVRILADDWRSNFIAKKGLITWRVIYSIVSLVGLVLLVYGFGLSRANPVFIWNPPPYTRYLAILLTYIAFILFAASSIPNNLFKKKLGHPMYAGIKIWAFAHLITNGRLGDMLLFGAFMLWAVVGFSSARRRDRKEGVVYPDGTVFGLAMTTMSGTIVWAVFAFYLHYVLIGVPPF